MKNSSHELIIIGGGASGLAAAVSYVQAGGRDVLILEAMEECGKKILATGNGRCNLTNTSAEGYEEIVEFFSALGVLTRADEEGRVYPASNQALTIRDALLLSLHPNNLLGHLGHERAGCGNPYADQGEQAECASVLPLPACSADSRAEYLRSHEQSNTGGQWNGSLNNVKIEIGKRIDKIERTSDGFIVGVSGSRETWTSKKLIVASGGSAGPAFGTHGDSFSFARSLGLSIEPTLPVLVPLEYKDGRESELSILKGVRAKANAVMYLDGEKVGEASGEVQFTNDGISGIVIFDLSRFLKLRKSRDDGIVVRLDLAPDISKESIAEVLKNNTGIGLGGIVNKKLADFVEAKISKNRDDSVEEAADMLKGFEIEISGSKGWKEAQVTAGGVAISEINLLTGQSLKVTGLYFTGEALNRDYICGGFNLSNAWLTGMRAGAHAAGGAITFRHP